MDFRTLRWKGDSDGSLYLIDQTRLPSEFVEIECREVDEVWRAIRTLQVRGAPAIGIAAAYGVCLGLRGTEGSVDQLVERLDAAADRLASSRPTAVNLFWALDRMRRKARQLGELPPRQWREAVLAEAHAICEEDGRMCRAIGRHGAELLADGAAVLTHCNAGGLATGDFGTALALVYAAVEQGKRISVFADETRPLLQGARLTAWELHRRGVPVTLICDSMAAVVMRQCGVSAVIVGADRIAANGDTANKIGTYGLAILARAHQVPFYVAAPTSTFDLSIAGGNLIPIEQRDEREIVEWGARRIAPEGIGVFNPAFDVTPAELISAIVTENGVVQPVSEAAVRAVCGPQRDGVA